MPSPKGPKKVRRYDKRTGGYLGWGYENQTDPADPTAGMGTREPVPPTEEDIGNEVEDDILPFSASDIAALLDREDPTPLPPAPVLGRITFSSAGPGPSSMLEPVIVTSAGASAAVSPERVLPPMSVVSVDDFAELRAEIAALRAELAAAKLASAKPVKRVVGLPKPHLHDGYPIPYYNPYVMAEKFQYCPKGRLEPGEHAVFHKFANGCFLAHNAVEEQAVRVALRGWGPDKPDRWKGDNLPEMEQCGTCGFRTFNQIVANDHRVRHPDHRFDIHP